MRYMFILLLVNIYGRSLGGPVPDQNSNGKLIIGNLLNELSKQCKNAFVSGQIKNNQIKCDMVFNNKVDDFRCLMFYDANRLLCNITALTASDLETDFKAKIIEKQNASAFCTEALNFAVPGTPDQEIVPVFKNLDKCKRVCTDDDIRTSDTNFFCRYYKWSLLKLPVTQSSLHGSSSVPTVSAGSGTSNDIEKDNVTVIQESNPSGGQVKKISDAVGTQTQQVKVEETNQGTSETAKQVSSAAQLTVSQNPGSLNLPSTVDNTKKSTVKSVVNVETADNVEDRDAAVELNEGGIGAGIENNPSENKDPEGVMPQLETPRGKIGLDNDDPDNSMDMGDDGKDDDADDTNGDEVEEKLELEAKKSAKSQVSLNDGVQREFFQNPDGFTEDDDHFFPFFLTAVIVVVVLYVLYHNKNKVGKMFFGLIVEGRQPGRRRTSRGHAYRRLDTLEQAMSANTPAPPSKIIY